MLRVENIFKSKICAVLKVELCPTSEVFEHRYYVT